MKPHYFFRTVRASRISGSGPYVSLVALALVSCTATDTSPPREQSSGVLSIDGFFDAIHHERNKYGDTFPRYEASQVAEIADNILLLQHANGGWNENRDPLRIFTDEERAELVADKSSPRGSFDNRNVYTQIEYLMGAYERLGDARYKVGALNGLDYLLSHQMQTCGGWPHTVPASSDYHPLLTIADEVLSGPLTLLRSISNRDWPFESFDGAIVERARKALARGDACVLQLQVRQGDRLTGWAGQYNPQSLEPWMGRTFELPSIATEETVYILRYLMAADDPSPEVIASIEGGVDWLKSVAIHDTRLEEYELDEPVRFKYHTATHERRLVKDQDAPLLWARFYDLDDNSVVLANRDSVRVDDYQDISPERRTGYHWYGTWANSLLEEDYPDWTCRISGADSCDEQ